MTPPTPSKLAQKVAAKLAAHISKCKYPRVAAHTCPQIERLISEAIAPQRDELAAKLEGESARLQFVADQRDAAEASLSSLSRELAKIFRLESGDEPDEWLIPAEPGPLGPFPIMEAMQELMNFFDREFEKADKRLSSLSLELEQLLEKVDAYDKFKRCFSEVRAAAERARSLIKKEK